MSMNLARQSYSLDPEYFIAGTTIRIITEVKTAGADLKAHVPVVLTDGKVTAVADADATGLYGITADSASSGDDVVVYLTGEFFADALEMPDGVTAADIEVAFRDIGIFLK